MSAQAIISEFFLLYVIIYDNVRIKDGENMEELRQRRKIISQLVEARLEKGILRISSQESRWTIRPSPRRWWMRAGRT